MSGPAYSGAISMNAKSTAHRKHGTSLAVGSVRCAHDRRVGSIENVCEAESAAEREHSRCSREQSAGVACWRVYGGRGKRVD